MAEREERLTLAQATTEINNLKELVASLSEQVTQQKQQAEEQQAAAQLPATQAVLQSKLAQPFQSAIPEAQSLPTPVRELSKFLGDQLELTCSAMAKILTAQDGDDAKTAREELINASLYIACFQRCLRVAHRDLQAADMGYAGRADAVIQAAYILFEESVNAINTEVAKMDLKVDVFSGTPSAKILDALARKCAGGRLSETKASTIATNVVNMLKQRQQRERPQSEQNKGSGAPSTSFDPKYTESRKRSYH